MIFRKKRKKKCIKLNKSHSWLPRKVIEGKTAQLAVEYFGFLEACRFFRTYAGYFTAVAHNISVDYFGQSVEVWLRWSNGVLLLCQQF